MIHYIIHHADGSEEAHLTAREVEDTAWARYRSVIYEDDLLMLDVNVHTRIVGDGWHVRREADE